jgi:triacylglycerol lipase
MALPSSNSKFNPKAAIFLAAMSFQTYPLFFEGRMTLPKGFKLRYTINAFTNVENPTEEIFGFVAESKNTIIIAFRGYAAYPGDLLAAYDIFQIPYPFVRNAGKTSRGFTCIYQSTRNKLIRVLKELSSKKKMFITGHNYGGALSTLAALDIATNTAFKNPFIYTYGSPRVGDPDFAIRFNHEVENSFRIVNIHDPFPTFPAREYPPPFTDNGIKYKHVANRYPISFQLNNVPRNDGIACYFKNLSQKDPEFSQALCAENPGFCPNTDVCIPFQGIC